MRTLYELYCLMTQYNKETGEVAEPLKLLSHMTMTNRVTQEEHNLLELHLKLNKPWKTIHTKFYNHVSFRKAKVNKLIEGSWWLPVFDARRQIRLFLLKMRAITKAKQDGK